MTTTRDTHGNPVGCVDGNLPNICPTCIHAEVCEHNDGGVKACLTYLPANVIDTLTAERDAALARARELEAGIAFTDGLLARVRRRIDEEVQGCDEEVERPRTRGDCMAWSEVLGRKDGLIAAGNMIPWRVGDRSFDVVIDAEEEPTPTPQLEREVKGGDLGKEGGA